MWCMQDLVRQSPSRSGKQVLNDERSHVQLAYGPALDGPC